jgi:hypothetical protein
MAIVDLGHVIDGVIQDFFDVQPRDTRSGHQTRGRSAQVMRGEVWKAEMGRLVAQGLGEGADRDRRGSFLPPQARRDHEFGVAGEPAQVRQQGQGQRREGHFVALPVFRALRGDGPELALEVEFGACGAGDLARTLSGHEDQFQGQAQEGRDSRGAQLAPDVADFAFAQHPGALLLRAAGAGERDQRTAVQDPALDAEAEHLREQRGDAIGHDGGSPIHDLPLQLLIDVVLELAQGCFIGGDGQRPKPACRTVRARIELDSIEPGHRRSPGVSLRTAASGRPGKTCRYTPVSCGERWPMREAMTARSTPRSIRCGVDCSLCIGVASIGPSSGSYYVFEQLVVGDGFDVGLTARALKLSSRDS